MLRSDNVICGTTTTGTGTLTLAAPPSSVGGVDLDVVARALGFGNSSVVPVSYTINEFTDSTFATIKQTEKGIGTLTLGASSGIANCTLARTTLQTSATSLNSQPATQNINPGTGISIVTAANTLVFISPSAADLLAGTPYRELVGSTPRGVPPLAAGSGLNATTTALTSGLDYYSIFMWGAPNLYKRARVQFNAAYTGGTSNVWARLYAVGADGRPGKLLIDFGVLGTANSSLVATIQSSALHATGFFLVPGVYFLCLSVAFSGGSGTPTVYTHTALLNPGVLSTFGNWYNGLVAQMVTTATSSTGATPSDPANQTGYSAPSSNAIGFTLDTV